VIEARQEAKTQARGHDAQCRCGTCRLQAFLKVLANAGSYGIFAEMVRHELARGSCETVEVHTGTGRFDAKVSAPEEPGEFCFPPIAACITGAARLMLTLLERAVEDSGGSWMFCDTDSMAIAATKAGGLLACPGGPHRLPDGTESVKALSYAEVDAIRERFRRLNPYDQAKVPDLLKQEIDGTCLAISAKRYAIWATNDLTAIVSLAPVKISQHGLGRYLDPVSPGRERRNDKGELTWILEAWQWIARAMVDPDLTMPEWVAQSPWGQVRLAGFQRPSQQASPLEVVVAGSGRPGVEPLSQQRAEFVRLIAQGVSNTEACRTLGVNRRTGTRWRFGRSVPSPRGSVRLYPPVITKPVVVLSPRFLSENERAVIAHEHDRGTTVRATAMLLGRSPSTVSRELWRNTDPAGVYRPALAHRLARDRRRRHRLRRLACDGVLREFVQQHLDVRWSPEQIAATLRLEWPDDPRRQLSTESLYQALYTRDTVLVRSLRTGRHQRRPHQRGDSRRPRGLPQPMRSIEQRPAHVADRLEVGHFEGDLIMGASNRTAIATLVERSSRNVTLVHLGAQRTAAGLSGSLVDVFGAMPPGLARSLTWDQARRWPVTST